MRIKSYRRHEIHYLKRPKEYVVRKRGEDLKSFPTLEEAEEFIDRIKTPNRYLVKQIVIIESGRIFEGETGKEAIEKAKSFDFSRDDVIRRVKTYYRFRKQPS